MCFSIHSVMVASSVRAWPCRFCAYCFFHVLASVESAVLSARVSSTIAPMLCFCGMRMISCSTRSYFFSSASKSSSDGSLLMKALYAAFLLSFHR